LQRRSSRSKPNWDSRILGLNQRTSTWRTPNAPNPHYFGRDKRDGTKTTVSTRQRDEVDIIPPQEVHAISPHQTPRCSSYRGLRADSWGLSGQDLPSWFSSVLRRSMPTFRRNAILHGASRSSKGSARFSYYKIASDSPRLSSCKSV